MTPEELRRLGNFEDRILDLIEDHEDKVQPHEMIFLGVRLFSTMSFDMAPSEKVARDTIQAGIETGYNESTLGEDEANQ